MKPWLRFLGKRRPTSLSDQGQYAEEVSRPKAEPVKHENPKGIDGHSMTGRKKNTKKDTDK
jgi:hypothetical protein